MNSTETKTELPPVSFSPSIEERLDGWEVRSDGIICIAATWQTARQRLWDILSLRTRLEAVEKANGELVKQLELIRQSVSIGSDGRLELEDEEKFAKAYATAEAMKGEG